LELRDRLREELDRELDVVIANGALPRRFDEHELSKVDKLGAEHPATRSAIAAANAVHVRARMQNNQIARLRRQQLHVLRVPFLFMPGLDATALQSIASRLERGLGLTESA
jgi:hypothetical protein